MQRKRLLFHALTNRGHCSLSESPWKVYSSPSGGAKEEVTKRSFRLAAQARCRLSLSLPLKRDGGEQRFVGSDSPPISGPGAAARVPG